jgi:Pyruvate/2-oxoacid:ferredoxin oxidoreductase gamma subunit
MRLTEIRIAGFGGQGVILSAVVLGKAASIYENGFATMTQNFGPEARRRVQRATVVSDFGAVSVRDAAGHHGDPVTGGLQPVRARTEA